MTPAIRTIVWSLGLSLAVVSTAATITPIAFTEVARAIEQPDLAVRRALVAGSSATPGGTPLGVDGAERAIAQLEAKERYIENMRTGRELDEAARLSSGAAQKSRRDIERILALVDTVVGQVAEDARSPTWVAVVPPGNTKDVLDALGRLNAAVAAFRAQDRRSADEPVPARAGWLAACKDHCFCSTMHYEDGIVVAALSLRQPKVVRTRR